LSFEYSFEEVNRNLAWFNAYSDTIGQWAIKNEEEEEKEQEPKPATPVAPKPLPATHSTTVEPEPSSAPITLPHWLKT